MHKIPKFFLFILFDRSFSEENCIILLLYSPLFSEYLLIKYYFSHQTKVYILKYYFPDFFYFIFIFFRFINKHLDMSIFFNHIKSVIFK